MAGISDDVIFAPVEFLVQINIRPKDLNKDLYQTIEKRVQKEYSGNCISGVGYIKPGSVQVKHKQKGKYEGSHFTGNMTFKVQLRCLAALPLKGMNINAVVTKKNDAGIVAKNCLFPYQLFVPNLPDDPNSDKLSSITRHSYVRVKVVDSIIKAPNMENAKAEYWVVCQLSDIDISTVRRLDLPSVVELSKFVLNTKGIDEINQDRMDLTDNAYETLQSSKKHIELINENYAKTLSVTERSVLKNDVVLTSKLGYIRSKTYVVVYVTDTLPDGKVKATVLLANDLPNIKHKSSGIFNLKAIDGKSPWHQIYVSSVAVFSDITDIETIEDADYAFNASVGNADVIDAWSLHVKYIINQYEMIHMPSIYRKQLGSLNKLSGSKIDMTYNRDYVINRAYYKMIEMMDQVISMGKKRIACIAESPGGFIQALIHQRTRDANSELLVNPTHDKITGISISIDGNGTWSKLRKLLQSKYNDVLVDSELQQSSDKTLVTLIGDSGNEGDILIEENRQRFVDHFDEKADLVTADGGFERDKSESDTEEMDTSKLIMAEISMALNVQAPGGSFVLKIFDMATKVSVGFLTILSYCYDNVSVFKPHTSRHASSEKYVICRGYKLPAEELEDITKVLENIIDYNLSKNEYLSSIMLVDHDEMTNTIKHYNNIFMKKQGDFIIDGYQYGTLYNNSMDDHKGLANVVSSYTNRQYQNVKEFRSKYST